MAEQFDRLKAYKRFWSSFLLKAEDRTDLFKGLVAKERLYLTVHSEWKDIIFHPVVKSTNAHVELLVGVKDPEEIDQIYAYLNGEKEHIERQFGNTLEWLPRGDRGRRAQVRKSIYTGGWKNDDTWDPLQFEMIDNLVNLHKVTIPIIRKYWQL